MNRLADKISDAELEVMQVLWSEEDALPLSAIRTAICKKNGWESSTAKTLVSRLVSKGVIWQEKRDVFYYHAGITAQEYRDYSTQQLLNRLYSGNAKKLVASLVSSKRLSEADIAELRAMFRQEDSHE